LRLHVLKVALKLLATQAILNSSDGGEKKESKHGGEKMNLGLGEVGLGRVNS
jgi:hypothetical protein